MVELILLIGFIVWMVVSIRKLPQVDYEFNNEPWYKRIDDREREKREEKVKEDFFMRE